jgi:S-formylglutathione hydrolase
MYSYVTRELPEIVQTIGVASDRQSIFGHSMGGHGALICALKNSDRYASVSAFAPICSPSRVPWGEKAFTGYLGSDRERWNEYDAVELLSKHKYDKPILIDQGRADKFLEVQLKPQLLEEACRNTNTKLNLHYRDGYDHGYYFISTFMADHLQHHAAFLR